MRLRIRTKLSLGIGAVLLGFIGSTTLIFSQTLQTHVRDDMAASRFAYERFLALQRRLTAKIAESLAQMPHLRATLDLEEKDPETLRYAAQTARRTAGVTFLQLEDDAGRIVGMDPVGAHLDKPALGQEEGHLTGFAILGRKICFVGAAEVVLGGRLLGRLVVGREVDREFMVELSRVTGMSSMMLLDGWTLVGMTPDGDPWDPGQEQTDRLLAELADGRTFGEFELGGQSCFATLMQLSGPRTATILACPTEDLLGAHRTSKRLLMLASLAFVLLALVISQLQAWRLSRPIHALIDGSRRLADGDLSVQVDEQGNDELATLSMSFNGMARQIEALIVDVREQSEALESLNTRLSQEHKKLATILESLSDGVIYVGPDWQVLFCNTTAARLLGRTEDAMIGQDLRPLLELHDETTPGESVDDRLQGVMAGQSYASESATVAHAEDRRLPVTFRISRVREEGGAVLVFHDLSEQRRAAAAIREAKVEAEAARRAERAKSEFLANMSHEMRTPMHGILSFARFGKEKVAAGKTGATGRYFERILDSADRLLNLLNSLLDLSKLESKQTRLEIMPVDLRVLLESVREEFDGLASERRQRIELRECPDVRVELDAARIMQVVRNLIANASKFSPPDSTIEIGVDSFDDRVRVRVEDRGTGIPADELHLVFKKFVQSSRTTSGAGGTGLGLAICRDIVSLHGGQIWAENRPGGGTSFRFELPLVVGVGSDGERGP